MLKFYKSLEKYFFKQTGQLNFLGNLIKAVFFFIVLKLAIKTIAKFINRTLDLKRRDDASLDTRRMETLARTLRNVLRVLAYFIYIIIVLEMFHIDTKSIIATAGIGGVAIGFGAQSLVKDVINGFFILQDNLYVVGDHVEIKGLEGIVEELGLRTTKIKGFEGDLHIIPNGEIQIITNRSRGAIRSLNIITVAYGENLDRVIAVLESICREIEDEYSYYIETDLGVDGVVKLGDNGVDLRITGMIKSGYQWDIERIIMKRVKERFEEEAIEIPYRKIVVAKEEII